MNCDWLLTKTKFLIGPKQVLENSLHHNHRSECMYFKQNIIVLKKLIRKFYVMSTNFKNVQKPLLDLTENFIGDLAKPT